MVYTYPRLSIISEINMPVIPHRKLSEVNNCLANRNSKLNSAVNKGDYSNF